MTEYVVVIQSHRFKTIRDAAITARAEYDRYASLDVAVTVRQVRPSHFGGDNLYLLGAEKWNLPHLYAFNDPCDVR